MHNALLTNNIIEGGQVVFTGTAGGEAKELMGYYPTVSLNKNGHVLVVFEQLSPLRKIFAQYGEIEKSGEVRSSGEMQPMMALIMITCTGPPSASLIMRRENCGDPQKPPPSG